MHISLHATMFRCARAAALTHTRSYGTRVACAPAPRVAAMSSSSSLLVSQRSAIALPLAVSCRRSLATAAASSASASAPASASASAASVADLAAVTAWRAGKALVDLRSILDSERATSQGAAYERRMEEYVLYDDAPTAVLSFWFANKPPTVARTVLHYNALMLSKANARELSVDDVLATKSRMKADGVAADEATYEVRPCAHARCCGCLTQCIPVYCIVQFWFLLSLLFICLCFSFFVFPLLRAGAVPRADSRAPRQGRRRRL